jgi:hypothetical protein
MRRIYLYMMVLFLSLLPLQFVDARDSIEEVEGTGLVIRSDPSGARVYVDGIERGFTPLTLGNLPGGEYYIRLHKDDLLGVRYVDRRFKVTLHSTSRLVVSVDLEEAKGRIALSVKRSPGSPGEAALALEPKITVDGKSVDVPVLNIPAGYRTIRVRAFGWEEVSKTVYVEEDKNQLVEFELKPAPFVMSAAAVRRGRFNPANAGSLGSAEIVFTVSGPGRGKISIVDSRGEEVFAKETGPFTGWSQSLRWDGKSGGIALKDGIYTVLIEAESISWNDSPPVRTSARLPVELDSSLYIRPLTLSPGKAGLLFAALPETLPRYSFQVEGSLFFGRAPVTEKTWGTLPFSAALRFSPMDRLEAAAALNVIPEFNADMSAAAGGSIKWLYWKGGSLPLEAAAGLAYAWAEEGSVTPFGMGTGVELFLPLGWRPHGGLSLSFSPGIIWTGEKGYPGEAAPRAIVSGGLLFQHGVITAGLSARSEFAFAGEGKGAGPVMLGAECKFFPPPSIFVITLHGGAWFEGSRLGGFGGVGIGMIY